MAWWHSATLERLTSPRWIGYKADCCPTLAEGLYFFCTVASKQQTNREGKAEQEAELSRSGQRFVERTSNLAADLGA